MKNLFVMLLCFCIPTIVSADCNERVANTTPTNRFVLKDDGTTTDTLTGLMWMRCSIGQTWDSGNCVGSPLMLNWEQALLMGQTTHFASASDWRLPYVSELKSILEASCYLPSINSTVFPNTENDAYWTSSAAKGVDFQIGQDGGMNKIRKHPIRLVKIAP